MRVEINIIRVKHEYDESFKRWFHDIKESMNENFRFDTKILVNCQRTNLTG